MIMKPKLMMIKGKSDDEHDNDDVIENLDQRFLYPPPEQFEHKYRNPDPLHRRQVLQKRAV